MAYNKQRALSLAAFMAAAIPAWTQSGQFRIEEASIADIQNAIEPDRRPAAGRAGLSRQGEGVQRRLHGARHQGRRADPAVDGDGPRRRADSDIRQRRLRPRRYFQTSISTRASRSSSDRWTRRSRIRACNFSTACASAFPNAGQAQCARDTEHSRRTLDHLQRRFRPRAVGGPLPPGAPAVCEEFRKQPDALERAAELDKQYGRNPDLDDSCRCTAPSSRSRTGTTRRTCAAPAATT